MCASNATRSSATISRAISAPSSSRVNSAAAAGRADGRRMDGGRPSGVGRDRAAAAWTDGGLDRSRGRGPAGGARRRAAAPDHPLAVGAARVKLARFAIWVATASFVFMLFYPLVMEILARIAARGES